MRDAFRMVAAFWSALSTRRDLLLEILALRHQLGVLGRSDRRFRPSDRLLWVCLRRWWPRWREALVLVQPATVTRWHREGFHGWWRHRSRRRPGRPRIDVQLRSLMGHMATENCLWGAPRIHSEVLKLGFTWRTFLANHLGAAFSSPVTASDAPGDNHVVRGCKFTFGFAASPGNESGASNQWAAVDWPPSLQRTSLGCRDAQAHLHHC